jgi:hypothetical protein
VVIHYVAIENKYKCSLVSSIYRKFLIYLSNHCRNYQTICNVFCALSDISSHRDQMLFWMDPGEGKSSPLPQHPHINHSFCSHSPLRLRVRKHCPRSSKAHLHLWPYHLRPCTWHCRTQNQCSVGSLDHSMSARTSELERNSSPVSENVWPFSFLLIQTYSGHLSDALRGPETQVLFSVLGWGWWSSLPIRY